MLKVVHDAEASSENTAGGSLLDQIVRDGARQLLAAALQAEVAAYVGAFTDELDQNGRRLVVRNDCHAEREVTTAAGAVPVRAPRVNDKRIDEGDRRAAAVCLGDPAGVGAEEPAGGRGVALLYLHGLSSSDFGPALGSSWAPATACRRPRSPG
jgi:hypothetical protein